ncbi:MAG: transcriptional regulator [Segetibacter sp.]|nr:transcriptional regulator [Segetibacter sp.]
MTVDLEGDFVVFIISMRINRWWKIHRWLPVAMAMPRMLKELYGKPESGFLGAESSLALVVQYWKTFEHLEAYAKDRNGAHYPAWKAFNTKMKSNGDVGIWHETYKIRAGEYECIYNNMPPYGLGKVGKLIPAAGRKESAADRLYKSRDL